MGGDDMAFIPTPNCAVMTIGYVDNWGKGFSNNFSFQRSTPFTVPNLNQLISTAEDAFDELIKPYMSNFVSLVRFTARAQDAEDAPSVVYDLTTPITGTRSGELIALHTAMSVTLRTGLAGRSFRGRLYHSGLVDTDLVTSTRWVTATATQVGQQYGSFAGAIEEDTTAQQVVISRQMGGVELAEGVPTVITQHVGRTPIATVRLRVRP